MCFGSQFMKAHIPCHIFHVYAITHNNENDTLFYPLARPAQKLRTKAHRDRPISLCIEYSGYPELP